MKQPYHHGNLSEALINRGLEQLEEHGLDSLSLRGLADQIGVSKTAPYRHFKTKHDLLIALAAEGYQRFADMLEEQERRLSGENTNSLLEGLYTAYGHFAQGQPELYRLMFSRLGNSLHSERCKLNAQRAFSVVLRMAAQLEPQRADPRSLAVSLFANLHGWVMILMDDLIPPEAGATWDSWTRFARLPQVFTPEDG